MKKQAHKDDLLRTYKHLYQSPQLQDYRALVQAIRAYVDTFSLPITMNTEQGVLTLTYHPRRHTAHITLDGPQSSVGFFGIYHHGIEELFFFRRHPQEQRMFVRSLRHHLDDDRTITHDMRWLCSALLTLGGENKEETTS